MKLFSSTDSFDFLVITELKMKSEVEEFGNRLGLNIKTFCLDFTTIFQAACARLFIFDFPEISNYEKILYLDTDIIIKTDIKTILDLQIGPKLYGIESGTLESLSFGGQFFNFGIVDKNQTGLNSGTLLFLNSIAMKDLFQRIRDHLESFTLSGATPPYCLDQPFINFHAFKDSLFDNQLLNPFVSLFEGSDTVNNYETSSVCHFSYPIGNFGHKFHRMKEFFKKLLDEYFTRRSEMNESLVYQQFHWDKANIVFDKENILMTTWARGHYNCLSKYVYEVTWSGIKHFALFNESFTAFVSIRYYDISIGYSLINYVLKDTIPEPSLPDTSLVTGNRKLIYCCAFHNKGYMELFSYLLASIKLFSRLDEDTDILIFTSLDFKPMVENISRNYKIPIKTKFFNFKTMHEAGCARIHIFDYEEINKYSKILYLDTDIIVQGDLMRLFDSLKEDKLYAKKEYDLNGAGHGGYFFDFTKFKKEQDSLNSGTLLFRNSPKIRAVFSDIINHIKILKQTSSIMPNCMDQSFIAFHFIRNSMFDIETISPHIQLSGDPGLNYNSSPPEPLSEDLILCHFIWPLGDCYHKMNRMKKHIRNLLDTKIE